MKVHRDIRNLPQFLNAAITIGTFDGVHNGHRQIIAQLKKEAAENHGECVLITFDPHPRMVLNKGKNVKLLNTLSEKTELLEKQEVDHLVVVPFTNDFSNQTPEEYIEDFLVKNFHPATIIIGYDHRFGKDRAGDYRLLESRQNQFGYKVKEIPEQVLHDITISSTKIRQALENYDFQTAKECLGYDYFFQGTVVEGNKLGRTLGYPTANLEVENEDKLVPPDGIYAVNVALARENDSDILEVESYHQGMMSIGYRPTIDDGKRMIEVNIFDFNQNIYGRRLRVYLKFFLRKEEKFDSMEALKNKIAEDKARSLELLKI